MAVSLDVQETTDVLILNPKGDLIELSDGDDLLFEIDNHSDALKVLINCQQIKHLNSTGINVLLKAFTQIRNRGGELALCSLSKNIEKILIITKLNSIFSVFPNMEAALTYLKTQ